MNEWIYVELKNCMHFYMYIINYNYLNQFHGSAYCSKEPVSCWKQDIPD